MLEHDTFGNAVGDDFTATFDVGVDLDGVCYDFYTKFADVTRLELGIDVDRRDTPNTWRFYEAWGLTDDDFVDLMRIGVLRRGLWWEGDPYDNVVEGWQQLRERGHRLHVVTARAPDGAVDEAQAATHHWLNTVGLHADTVTFTSDKTEVCTVATGPRVAMIEDSPANIAACRTAGITTLALDQPWNRHVDVATGHRVSSLLDVVDVLDRHAGHAHGC